VPGTSTVPGVSVPVPGPLPHADNDLPSRSRVTLDAAGAFPTGKRLRGAFPFPAPHSPQRGDRRGLDHARFAQGGERLLFGQGATWMQFIIDHDSSPLKNSP